jgi:hypothetical protein
MGYLYATRRPKDPTFEASMHSPPPRYGRSALCVARACYGHQRCWEAFCGVPAWALPAPVSDHNCFASALHGVHGAEIAWPNQRVFAERLAPPSVRRCASAKRFTTARGGGFACRPGQVSPLPELAAEAFEAPEEEETWKAVPVLLLEAPAPPTEEAAEDVERRASLRGASSPVGELASPVSDVETASRRQTQTTVEVAREYRERLEAEVRVGQEHRAGLAAQRSHWAQGN